MTDPRAVFRADGPLARVLSGYAPRMQQDRLAEAVAEALAAGSQLVVEAGTGVGKTFGYLVPALLSGMRVIVSTGTRHLQDQLYHRDLPLVREALGYTGRVALLKGRSNYLCLHRLQLAREQVGQHSAGLTRELELIAAWQRHSRSGDVTECPELPEDARAWPLATSTVENCLGQECPAFADCYVVRARRQAQQADLVVVNHHLFCADLALKEDGFGEVLPSANAFVFDEAHQLPDTASTFFGQRISSRRIAELGRDTVQEQLREAPELFELRGLSDGLATAAAQFRLALGAEARRQAWAPLLGRSQVARALERLNEALNRLHQQLAVAADRGRGLEACTRRSAEMLELLGQFGPEPQTDDVYWCETSRAGFVLQRTPLDVGAAFQRQREAYRAAWVFTSATLAVGDDFSHFCNRLGLEPARELRLDSPFDFRRQGLLYTPDGLPEPNAPDYDRRLLEVVRPVLQASAGRAFLLFTSHRALRLAAQALREHCPYPLLVQGDAPKPNLIERFVSLGNAVLLGTSSFWEGVDVRGSALSVVVIDRLPFAAPGDPVLQARLEALRSAGENPFASYQLPQAVLALKQGVGRLIRDVRDRGILVICDPRLRTRSYGAVFLDSLPPMPRTGSLAAVQRFFAEGAQAEV